MIGALAEGRVSDVKSVSITAIARIAIFDDDVVARHPSSALQGSHTESRVRSLAPNSATLFPEVASSTFCVWWGGFWKLVPRVKFLVEATRRLHFGESD